MKVVIINQHPKDFLGGSEIQCDIIARKLQEFGHQVLYLACKGKGDYDTPYPVRAVLQSANIIAQATISENPDVVYWRNNLYSFRNTVKKIRNKGIPVAFAVSSVFDTIKWGSRAKPPEISYFRHFISNTTSIIKRRWNHNGFKWVNGVIVNNTCHLGKLNYTPQIYIPNSNISTKIDFEWVKPYICWIANIKASKRPELCIEVAKKLGDNYDVLMVGKIQNPSYNWIKDSKSLPKNLIYLGPKSVTEVNGIIFASLCLIHTCAPEGFPGNFVQAWLQGKPVVSYEFDPGGLIKSEKLGFVSDSSIDRFILNTKALIENSTLRKEIGYNSKNYADKNFNPDINVRKLEAFLFDIVNNSRYNQ